MNKQRMNVLLISCGNLSYDGRLREILNIAKKIGRVIAITADNTIEAESIIEKDVFAYPCNNYERFIRYCVKKSKEIGKIDILFIDNRKAIIPSLIIKKIKKINYVVQDVRELYFINEVKHFSGKVGCLIEQYMIKRSDLILCANSDRAVIMKKYYGLANEPTVFENYRHLKYSADFIESCYEQKYAGFFSKDKIKLIATSGCSIFRTSDILVRNISKCKNKVELYFVGANAERDETIIYNISKELKLDNIHILGQVKEDELKYLISKCDIGIVNYGMEDSNNIYCASGKIYEFLFEGKPVVTTENPPLKKICDSYQIGCCCNEYTPAIDKVIDNYAYFKGRVEQYVNLIDIEKNNQNVADIIAKSYMSK